MGECGCNLEVHRCNEHGGDVIVVLSQREFDEALRLANHAVVAWGNRDAHVLAETLDRARRTVL